MSASADPASEGTKPRMEMGVGIVERVRAQYPMRSCSEDAKPENENFALKLGGPMNPFAGFEATVPSVGMPKRPVSSLPFLFSSWKHATA